jgi:BirA family transcriptional regulator, biotin operon repressor / biotin---[acetyl-CoA-carboxylase] ligase
MEIIRLNEIESTNTYAKRLLAENKISQNTCIITSIQTSGRGMQQNIWESQANKNLTFSIICFPDFLPVARQFQLNKIVSLSVLDLVKKTLSNDNLSVKWPNDIYIGTSKVAGILIETSVVGHKLNWVVIGIGINVNQKEFSTGLPNPISLIHHTGGVIDLYNLLNTYIHLFDKRYTQLIETKTEDVDNEYLNSLFKFGIPSRFIYKEAIIKATIMGVNEYGWLQLVTSENRIIECEMKEIAYVI